MEAEVQGHPTRAQPHEGSGKGSSSSLYGHHGTINGIPVHSRGVALPSFVKIHNAANRNVRRNERPH